MFSQCELGPVFFSSTDAFFIRETARSHRCEELRICHQTSAGSNPSSNIASRLFPLGSFWDSEVKPAIPGHVWLGRRSCWGAPPGSTGQWSLHQKTLREIEVSNSIPQSQPAASTNNLLGPSHQAAITGRARLHLGPPASRSLPTSCCFFQFTAS